MTTEILVLPFNEAGVPTGYEMECVTRENMNDAPEEWIYFFDTSSIARNAAGLIAPLEVNPWLAPVAAARYTLAYDAEGDVFLCITERLCAWRVCRVRFDAGHLAPCATITLDEATSGMLLYDADAWFLYICRDVDGALQYRHFADACRNSGDWHASRRGQTPAKIVHVYSRDDYVLK